MVGKVIREMRHTPEGLVKGLGEGLGRCVWMLGNDGGRG